MSLKVALGWSFTLHLMLFTLPGPANFIPPAQALNKMEVIFEPEPIASGLAQKRPLSAKAQTTPAASVSSLQEASHEARDISGLSHRETPAPTPGAKQLEPVPQPVALRSASPILEGRSPKVSSPPKIDWLPAPSGVSLLPEREFALFQHKQMVRERLKGHLTYPTLWVQGSVRLHLTVKADGTLQEASVQEATDPRLATAALSGAQNAAPYPRFPKEMEEAQVDYDFSVQYSLD